MPVIYYILSAIGIGTYMSHFWQVHPVSTILWIIASICGIACIYGGIIGHSTNENAISRSWLLATAVIGSLILLGLTLSAIFIFVPAMP